MKLSGNALPMWRFMDGWLRYAGIVTGQIPSHAVRTWLYRHVFQMNLGKGAIIYGRGEYLKPTAISIGDRSIIGVQAKLDGRQGITIGNDVNLGAGVWIYTEQHNPQCPHFSTEGRGGPVVIGDRAWISARTIILPAVSIGEGAVIAAGAIVTRDVEPFTIVAGVPAVKIADRNRDLRYKLGGKPVPFI